MGLNWLKSIHHSDSLTVNQPVSAGTPARADAYKVHWEQLTGIVGQEGSGITFTTNSDDVVVPTHPETTELSSIQNAGCWNLNDIGLLTILTNDRLAVFPATNEDLINWSTRLGAWTQSQVGVFWRAYLEGEHSSTSWKELIFQLIGCIDFCNNIIYIILILSFMFAFCLKIIWLMSYLS